MPFLLLCALVPVGLLGWFSVPLTTQYTAAHIAHSHHPLTRTQGPTKIALQCMTPRATLKLRTIFQRQQGQSLTLTDAIGEQPGLGLRREHTRREDVRRGGGAVSVNFPVLHFSQKYELHITAPQNIKNERGIHTPNSQREPR